MEGFDDAASLLVGAAAGGPHRYRPVSVGDHIAPFGVMVVGGDLAGDVGDDGPVSGQVAGSVGEPGEGGQVDGERDRPSMGTLPDAFEEVAGDIGTQLVDGAGFPVDAKGLGGLVDAVADPDGTLGGQVPQMQVGGAIGGGLQSDPSVVYRRLIADDGFLGICLYGQLLQVGGELSGGQPRSLLQHGTGDLAGLGFGEM